MFLTLACALAQSPALPVAPPPRTVDPRIFAVRTGGRILVFPAHRPARPIFDIPEPAGARGHPGVSDDGRFLAVPLELDVLVYDLPTGRLLDTIPFPRPHPFFMDGYLAAFTDSPGLSEVDTQLVKLPAAGGKYAPYRPDSRRAEQVLLAWPGAVEVVDRSKGPTGTRRRLMIRTGVDVMVERVDRHPDGRYYAVEYKGKVVVVDVARGTAGRPIDIPAGVLVQFAGRDLVLTDPGNPVPRVVWTIPKDPELIN